MFSRSEILLGPKKYFILEELLIIGILDVMVNFLTKFLSSKISELSIELYRPLSLIIDELKNCWFCDIHKILFST